MTEIFNGSKAFLMIPISAARDEQLLKQPKSILLLGEIVSMLNVTGEFYMSNSTLADKLKCSKKSISNYLSQLEDMHLIKRQIYKKEGGEIDCRKITAGEELTRAFTKNWNASSNDVPRETDCHTYGSTLPDPKETHCHTLGKHIATKEEQYKKNNIRRYIYSSADAEQSIDSDKKAKAPAKTRMHKNNSIKAEPPIYKDVINYLNDKVGARYKASSAINKRLIHARVKEGYKLDDFKRVIDNKVASWAQDQQMSKYLRPQTLFGTKFESYLNETAPNKPPQTDFNVLKDDLVENIRDDELPF